tara:strand:- start:25 stop:345 length:321 start_codon:yes stop_codon:yes gene_type:complete
MTELQIKKIEIEGHTNFFFKDTPPTDEEFKLKYDEIEKDYSINKLRDERNILLAESDWTQVLDVSLSNMDEWKAYRQVLRDLPQTQPNITTDLAGNIIENVFPEKP